MRKKRHSSSSETAILLYESYSFPHFLFLIQCGFTGLTNLAERKLNYTVK